MRYVPKCHTLLCNHTLYLLQIASLVGVIFMVGVYLTVFSYWLGYPEWVGPLVMLGLISALFTVPIPLLYYRSRLWLSKICVRDLGIIVYM